MLRVLIEWYFQKAYNSILPLQNPLVFNFKEIFEKQWENKRMYIQA